MNITAVATPVVSYWKRIKLQHLATTGALALAAVALTGFSHYTRPVQQPQTSNVVWTTMGSHVPNHNSYVYYLVGSEAQRDAILAEADDSEPNPPATYYIIVRSLEDEITVYNTQRELTELGHTAQVMDMRNSSVAAAQLPTAGVSWRQQFGTAADAEFAAREFSPQMDVTRTQPTQPTFATAADAEFAARSLIQEGAH